MSLEKGIQHNKEHRKPYRGTKSYDKGCRNHGDCPWCQRNRHHQSNKDLERLRYSVGEYDRSEYRRYDEDDE